MLEMVQTMDHVHWEVRSRTHDIPASGISIAHGASTAIILGAAETGLGASASAMVAAWTVDSEPPSKVGKSKAQALLLPGDPPPG